MKRLIVVLSGLLVLPAFAEVAPAYYYDDVIEYSDTDIDSDVDDVVIADDADVAQDTGKTSVPTVASRTVANTNSRAAAASPRATASGRVASARNNATSSRTVTARTAATSRANVSRANVSRAAATSSANKNVSARRAVPSTTAARASIVQTDTVNTPLYTGRVGVRGQSVTTRVPTVRMAAASTATDTSKTSSASSTTDMDELAQVTDFCKAQYQSCMDNFCNVLDDNQGRCSCSKNLKNYEKTEAALKQATEDLQDVAQKIQYIGLSKDEVETLFTQTEAELKMQGSSDNSQLKTDLDKIKSLIVDVKSGSASSVSDSGLNFDLSGLLDFTVSSTGFDLSAFLGNSSNTSSISNQRGEQLYKTATARCKAAVLNTCSAQGVDVSVITNAYDLEIDKQCIVYERALTDSNDQMASTVRNAKSVLQKARLLVAQQKNTYDLRGCVNALDSCMQDDFVCGSDYENCLDPTGKYIVDGKIVVGSTPGQKVDADVAAPKYYTDNLYATWNYGDKKNAWGDDGTLSDYITQTVTNSNVTKTSEIMSNYLQYKIGYNADGKNYGMCMSVLNKCQDITYKGAGQNKTYDPQNNVVKEYLQRTLTQIKAKQDELLASYAETCISDVSSCLGQNGYSTSSTTTTSQSAKNIAINACRASIVTCMSVNGMTNVTPTPDSMISWVSAVIDKSATTEQPTPKPSGPDLYVTCAACKKGGYSWKNGTCVAKINYADIASSSACTTQGGSWTESYCVWTANNIPESANGISTNLVDIKSLWRTSPWKLEEINNNSIKVTCSKYSTLDQCKSAMEQVIQGNGNNFDYGESNIENPDWVNSGCVEKACE